LQNRINIEMRNASSGRNKGVIGTVLVHLMLFGMLILVGFSSPPLPETEEEGILVNFGNGETGIGLIEPSPPASIEKTSSPAVKEVKSPPPSPSKTVAKTREEPLLTQNSEEAPSVKKADPEVVKKRLEKIEADKKIKEQLEAERIIRKREDDEKKRIAAEQQRESDIMNRTKNALANSQNTGTSSTGEGIAGGPGNQGDPNGSINSKVRGSGSGLGNSGTGTGAKGPSYELEGRHTKGDLPLPKYEYQVEGTVVVEVYVDRAGKVVRAVPGTKGSTTLDDYLLKVAKDAALQARFEVKQDAPEIQKGKITYNFKFK
jgi:colicin import membrane protein